MRRLPIFLVIDVSESMAGDNLRQMQEGITRLLAALRRDPYALETVHLSVIAFAGVARTLAPLVELSSFYPPRLPIGAGTSLGTALNHIMDEINNQYRPQQRRPKGQLQTRGVSNDRRQSHRQPLRCRRTLATRFQAASHTGIHRHRPVCRLVGRSRHQQQRAAPAERQRRRLQRIYQLDFAIRVRTKPQSRHGRTAFARKKR